MSTINHSVITARLTPDRLSSYRAAVTGGAAEALALYDWNTRVGGSFHEDIGRVEVVFRNTLDEALTEYGQRKGWSTPWFARRQLFPGRHGQRAMQDIATARHRATRQGRAEIHGKVIAELTFGFWRYLCTRPYLTSLWVPALAGAFPNHPEAGNPRLVRKEVEDRVQRLHFLRNRIAHHEPIHARDLSRDHTSALELARWICLDTLTWVDEASRTQSVLTARP